MPKQPNQNRIQDQGLDRREFLKATGIGVAAASGLALPTFSAEPASAQNATRQKMQTYSYGSNQLDIYPARSPARLSAEGLTPVIAFVHGGAWRMGNKGRVDDKPEWFTAQGFTFISIGYTLFPAANAGTQAAQIGEATRFISQNIAKLGGDPNRIALIGHSAGCHLASLATLSGQTEGVKALICNDTRAYDLPLLARMYDDRLPLLYARPFAKRKFWMPWSPATHADNPLLDENGEKTGKSAHPPMLVAWSRGKNRDRLSESFAAKLDAAGAEVATYDGSRQYNHLSINKRMGRKGDPLTLALTDWAGNVLDRPDPA